VSAPTRTVLVTGGTGLVGDAVVAALEGVAVISLTRHGSAGWETGPRASRSAAGLLPERHAHVVSARGASGDAVHVQGDVTRPRLGLDPANYAELAERVDLVVHSAGVSDFTTPRRATDALNVEGTRHVAAFAEDARAPLYHVSTGYVNADGTSVNGRWGAEVYIASKRESERIARESDALAAIVRPSIVWADSRTGASPSFQGLHRLIGMMLQNRMPLLPFGPEVRVDFLPRDVIGGVIARLAVTGFEGEFWLTAGPAALPFGRIVEILLDYGRGLGLEMHPPRFVDRDMIERLIKPAGGEAVARRVDLLLALSSHFESQELLPTSLTPDEVPDLEQALRLGAEYWGERNGVAPAAEVPA
jgi:thioester reductase-like protein